MSAVAFLARFDHNRIAFFLIALSFGVTIIDPSVAKNILLVGYLFIIPELFKAELVSVRKALLVLLVCALSYYPLIYLYYHSQTGVDWGLYNTRNKPFFHYVVALILIFDEL